MKIPKFVKIGNLLYSIESIEKELADVKAVFGESSYTEQKIRLSSGLSKEKREETLIHEFVHLILNHYGYFQESDNEKMVRFLQVACIRF